MFKLTIPGWSPYEKKQFPWLNACLFAQLYSCFTPLHFLQGSQWQVTLVLPKPVCQIFNKSLNKGHSPGTKTSVQNVQMEQNVLQSGKCHLPALSFLQPIFIFFPHCGIIYSHFLSPWSPGIICSKMRIKKKNNYTVM